MILYCSAIPALIYPLLVHKLGKNHDEKAVLMYDANIFESRGLSKTVKAFKNQGIFSDVIGCDMFVDRNLKGTALKNNVIEHFDNIFSKNGYDLTSFEKIYVLNDTWDGDINLYLNYKEIRYTWIEVVQNYLCGAPSPAMNPSYAAVVKKHKSLTPLAKYADACLLEDSERSQKKLAYKGFTLWNIKESFETIGERDLDAVGKCFSINKLKNTDNGALIIRNSYGYTSSRSFGSASSYVKILNGMGNYPVEVIFSTLEKLAYDFYAPDAKVRYLKGHPNDSLDDSKMNEIFNGEVSSFTDMPFEFVIKYFSKKCIKFDTIIGYSSNSLKNIDSSVYNKLYVLGEEYLKSWYYYCSIYAVLRYAVELGVSAIYADSIAKTQLEFLMESMGISIAIHELNLDKMNLTENSLAVINCLETKLQSNYNALLPKIQRTNTACFINVELSEGFFEGEYSGFFVPLRIRKKKLTDSFTDIFHDENVWVYSRDQKVREKARSFSMKKALPRTGIEIFVEPISLPESVQTYKSAELINCRSKFNNLSLQYDVVSKRLDNIINILSDGSLDDKSDEYIRNSKSFEEYLDLLKIYRSRYMVLAAVRDTPGNCISPEIIGKMRGLGFTGFTNELWKMYIGITNRGKIIYNKTDAKKEEALNYTTDSKMNDLRISIKSMPWRNGDKAEIVINGVNYAVNIRGLNIVVFNLEKSKVIDSVGFDAHYQTHKFIHKAL